MTTQVTRLMVGWTALTNGLMAAGVVRWLVEGRGIVDVAPIVVFSILNAYIWMPIAFQAWRERQRPERFTKYPAGLCVVLSAQITGGETMRYRSVVGAGTVAFRDDAEGAAPTLTAFIVPTM